MVESCPLSPDQNSRRSEKEKLSQLSFFEVLKRPGHSVRDRLERHGVDVLRQGVSTLSRIDDGNPGAHQHRGYLIAACFG